MQTRLARSWSALRYDLSSQRALDNATRPLVEHERLLAEIDALAARLDVTLDTEAALAARLDVTLDTEAAPAAEPRSRRPDSRRPDSPDSRRPDSRRVA